MGKILVKTTWNCIAGSYKPKHAPMNRFVYTSTAQLFICFYICVLSMTLLNTLFLLLMISHLVYSEIAQIALLTRIILGDF